MDILQRIDELHYRQFLHMEGIQAAGLERVLHSGKIQTQKGVWD